MGNLFCSLPRNRSRFWSQQMSRAAFSRVNCHRPDLFSQFLSNTLFLKVTRIDLAIWPGAVLRVIVLCLVCLDVLWLIAQHSPNPVCESELPGWQGSIHVTLQDTCILESCLCTKTWIGTFLLKNMFWEWRMLMSTSSILTRHTICCYQSSKGFPQLRPTDKKRS